MARKTTRESENVAEAGVILDSTSSFEMNGGVLTNEKSGNKTPLVKMNVSDDPTQNTGKITVNAGYVVGGQDKENIAECFDTNGDETKVEISSNAHFIKSLAAEGLYNVEGDWYQSLTAAIDVADGKTIRPSGDIAVDEDVVIEGKTITFDLNGRKLDFTGHTVSIDNSTVILADHTDIGSIVVDSPIELTNNSKAIVQVTIDSGDTAGIKTAKGCSYKLVKAVCC